MKTLLQILTVFSLALCLAAAVFRFLDLASYGTYTAVLGVSSLVYFVAATSWAERRG
ncbi:MAG: hypothetical protein ACE15E_01315 [Acidobacteriota bacterium]